MQRLKSSEVDLQGLGICVCGQTLRRTIVRYGILRKTKCEQHFFASKVKHIWFCRPLPNRLSVAKKQAHQHDTHQRNHLNFRSPLPNSIKDSSISFFVSPPAQPSEIIIHFSHQKSNSTSPAPSINVPFPLLFNPEPLAYRDDPHFLQSAPATLEKVK